MRQEGSAAQMIVDCETRNEKFQSAMLESTVIMDELHDRLQACQRGGK